MNDHLKAVFSFIEDYKSNKNLELNVSFGKYSKEFGFDSECLHKESFDKIKTLLESCTSWDSVVDEIDEKFYENTEKTINSKIVTTDTTYDLFITIDYINKVSVFESEEFIKKTTCYSRKYHTYKLSEVKNKFKTYYTLNITLNFNKSVLTKYMYDSTFLKIIDIFNLLEKNNNLKFTEI